MKKSLRYPGMKSHLSLVVIVFIWLAASCSFKPSYEITYQVGNPGAPPNAVRLRSAAIDGSKDEDLFTDHFQSMVSEWASDGTRLITYGFNSHPYPGHYYMLDMVKKESQCLTCGEQASGHPVWSPSGEQIAAPLRDALLIIRLKPSSTRKIPLPGNPLTVSWSPGEDQLVLGLAERNGFAIYLVDRIHGTTIRLTRDDPVLFDEFGPQWSPNGDAIAFHSTGPGFQLCLMNADGTDKRKLIDWNVEMEIFDPGTWDPPAWSPDSEKLVFSSGTIVGETDIFLVRADGSGLVNLTDTEGEDYSPVWSPDGKKIAFVSRRDGRSAVYVMNPDGTDQVRISSLPWVDAQYPVWRPAVRELRLSAVLAVGGIGVLLLLAMLLRPLFNKAMGSSDQGVNNE
jgi:Tol biopolymer transport system component